jgi:hypothetical protein
MTAMKLRIRPDKLASSCLPFGFGPYLNVQPKPVCEEGAAIVCRVHSERKDYGELELVTGRRSKLVPGDVIVGVLGSRSALRGFSGRVPKSIESGDELHLLNVGGVIGRADGQMVGMGSPIKLEAMGAPILQGEPVILSDYGLSAAPKPVNQPPIIAVVGTCMNSGKSTAASALIRHLKGRGLRVHAGKATGVAAVRDPLSFRDHGAAVALTFLDCGIPSTAFRTDVPEITHKVLDLLSEEEPDAILLELGDGLLGSYGVDEILRDEEFQKRVTCTIVAGNDVIGAWAACHELTELGFKIACVTGPATDNLAGVRKLAELGLPGANMLREPEVLFAHVDELLGDVS